MIPAQELPFFPPRPCAPPGVPSGVLEGGLQAPGMPGPAGRRTYVPRASTARMHCCTKRGTWLLSRSHSTASAQPNTWSGGKARQRRLAPAPPAPSSPGPSCTSDVALLPQRLQRGPLQQELAELVPDLAQVALQTSVPRGGHGCPTGMGMPGLDQSVAPGLARQP